LGGVLVGLVVVVRGGGADQLDVHALGVHRGQAHGGVGQAGDALADHGAAEGEGGGAVAAGVQLLGLGVAGQAGDKRLDLGQQDVGVHVHGGRVRGGGVHE